MNLRKFFKVLGVGAVAAPTAVKAIEAASQPATAGLPDFVINPNNYAGRWSLEYGGFRYRFDEYPMRWIGELKSDKYPEGLSATTSVVSY